MYIRFITSNNKQQTRNNMTNNKLKRAITKAQNDYIDSIKAIDITDLLNKVNTIETLEKNKRIEKTKENLDMLRRTLESRKVDRKYGDCI